MRHPGPADSSGIGGRLGHFCRPLPTMPSGSARVRAFLTSFPSEYPAHPRCEAGPSSCCPLRPLKRVSCYIMRRAEQTHLQHSGFLLLFFFLHPPPLHFALVFPKHRNTSRDAQLGSLSHAAECNYSAVKVFAVLRNVFSPEALLSSTGRHDKQFKFVPAAAISMSSIRTIHGCIIRTG